MVWLEWDNKECRSLNKIPIFKRDGTLSIYFFPSEVDIIGRNCFVYHIEWSSTLSSSIGVESIDKKDEIVDLSNVHNKSTRHWRIAVIVFSDNCSGISNLDSFAKYVWQLYIIK